MKITFRISHGLAFINTNTALVLGFSGLTVTTGGGVNQAANTSHISGARDCTRRRRDVLGCGPLARL